MRECGSCGLLATATKERHVMRISELIARLRAVVQRHGDIEITDMSGQSFSKILIEDFDRTGRPALRECVSLDAPVPQEGARK